MWRGLFAGMVFRGCAICCISVFLGNLAASEQDSSAATNGLFITGIEEASPHYRYLMEWGRLPVKLSWCPGAQPFPLDLPREAQRARSIVAASKNITNQMSLTSIRIQRLFVPRWQLETHGRTALDFTNQWFVAFSWRLEGTSVDGTPLSRHEHVVMLLDGTLATEKLAANRLLKSRAEPRMSLVSPTAAGATNSPGQAALRPSAEGARPLAGLDAPDFRIPRVQWDPEQVPFPVDLNAQSARARRYLEEKTDIHEELKLDEVWVGSYTPHGAIQAQGTNIEANLHHWIITFTFLSSGTRSAAAYAVNMLLDGQILNVVDAPLSPDRSILSE